MTLTLHYHPLSSFCWKVLIGLYENDTPFAAKVVDLGDEADRAAFYALWPVGKFPVIEDRARGELVPESSAVLDYLDRYYPGPTRFTPADPDLAWRVRLWDRVIDNHIHHPMQRVVANRIRPADRKDPLGYAEARAHIVKGYTALEAALEGRTWLSGDDFGLVECAAFPALHYGDKVQPIGEEHRRVRAYLERLTARPSVQKVLEQAAPFAHWFPAVD
jgi:glutathione S-transferase